MRTGGDFFKNYLIKKINMVSGQALDISSSRRLDLQGIFSPNQSYVSKKYP